MTKKYIVTDEKIVNTPSSTEQTGAAKTAFSAYGAYVELAKKLDKAATSAQNGYIPTVKETSTGSGTYELQLTAPTVAANANWTEDDTTAASYIQNKPFKAIGTGLTVKDVSGVQTLTADTQFQFKIFTTLPAASEDYKQTIALVLKTTTETGNVYDEYACVNTGSTETPVWAWERIGDLKGTVTQTPTAITVNGTDLQTATDAQIGLMSAADHADMQVKSNLVAAFQATTDDTHYPSEKLVKDQLDLKFAKADVLTTWNTTASTTQVPAESLVKTSLDLKVPFDTSSTSTAFKLGEDSDGYYIEE